MASDPSASKKRRIDSLEDSSSPGEHLEEPVDEKWTRQQDLYFEDATMVLLSSDGGMFSLSPHQPVQVEKYDDCPLIRLTDNSDELVYFLKAIMYSDYADDSQPMNPRAMAVVLRLSTKHFVQFLRRHMLLRFRRMIPTTFDELSWFQNERFQKPFSNDLPKYSLVDLFRDCNASVFLPMLLYYLSMQPAKIGDLLTATGICKGINLSDSRMLLTVREEITAKIPVVYAQIYSQSASNCFHGLNCYTAKMVSFSANCSSFPTQSKDILTGLGSISNNVLTAIHS
ncbi:hypothetical protein M422DRAFT_250139 [Sphaerobolus stellatus SS14]|nr:hypothetical protein M422DRAFT_250139 [Sphaerobolus stellatus SS14]